MDIEKLIEQLKGIAKGLVEAGFPKCANTVRQAATALSTLRAENERLKNKLSELAHLPFDKPGIGERTKLMAENAELRAELEQVKQERDVAIEQLHGHCPACALYTPNHNEGLCRFCCFEVARNTNVEINDNWEWRGQKEE